VVGTYTIGELARAAGVNVETVRFYERRGLLRQPERGDGYRRYPESDLDRLRFVRRAKVLGFTLAEITELLDAASAGATDDVVAAARDRLASVDVEIAALQDQRRRLEALADVCAGGDDGCLTLAVAAEP
jgi:MerR family transcriptional regulator, mercuric resistance operon regulatory protein